MKNNIKIHLARPDITQAEIERVIKVLKTPSLALGPTIKKFEDKIAQYAERKYAVAVNSGTSALHLIVQSLGIGPGDEVITTPFSFIASANCILFVGAKPVFIDIDPQSLNLDPSQIEKKITSTTKAILAVDIFGHPADWTPILKIAKKHKLMVIEDSCEALGSEYEGVKCGGFGDTAAFAFYPNKQITTGEGGMIVTDNKKIYEICLSLRNQGRDAQGGWLEHKRLGYNYRISDINCALGLAQLKRLNHMAKKRAKVAKMYDYYLRDCPNIKLPFKAGDVKINRFVYVIQLDSQFSQTDRDRILSKLRQKGIACSNYFAPIHLQPFYQELFGYKKGNFPITEHVSERTIALPFYNDLGKSKIQFIAKVLNKYIKQG